MCLHESEAEGQLALPLVSSDGAHLPSIQNVDSKTRVPSVPNETYDVLPVAKVDRIDAHHCC